MIWLTWFRPAIDLFASREHHQVIPYCSWFPDEQAIGRDAFSMIPWPQRSYLFPPTPLIKMALTRLQVDQITAILIVPNRPTSLWWDTLQDMLLEKPMVLGFHWKILIGKGPLPHLGVLLACLVGPQ